MAVSEKKVIGLVEDVVILGVRGHIKLKAKVDTGAGRTTVDSKVAAKAGLGPIISSVRIKSSTAKKVDRRPLAQATIIIAGVKFDIPASVADRRGMKYPVLIGMDILKSGIFLIDPSNLK